MTHPPKLPSLRRNLIKLYLLKGLAFAWFPIPTIMLFYQAAGLSLQDGLLLKAILSVSLLVFEIPSGYIADRVGRKFSLVAGGGIWTGAILGYCFGDSFAAFAIAEILTGLAGSLISGADTALGFDSLVQLGRERDYRTFEGRLVAVAGITEAVCGIIGGMVAAINLVYPFVLQAVAIACYCLIATTLVEPPRQLSEGKAWQQLGQIVQFALFKDKAIQALILFSAICANATFLIVWLSQGYLEETGFATESFGMAWALFHGVMSFVSVFAARWERWLGRRVAFASMVLLLGGAYLGLGFVQAQYGIIFIAIIYAGRGLKTPLVLNALNHYVSSDIRATVLSVNSFAFRVGFVVVGTSAGRLAEAGGLPVAFLTFGVIFLSLGGLCWQRLGSLGVFAAQSG